MTASTFSLAGKTIWVAGETGLVGTALTTALQHKDCTLLSAPHKALDLTRQKDTQDWLAAHKPDAVILAAAKVGGIGANAASPADFLSINLAIAQNVIDASHRAGVTKLLYLGSSCIYPKLAAQPITESALLTGPLEETNQWYAIAKIAGLKLCQAYQRQYGCRFISAMPTNLYGPHDRFDAENSHVIPAMMLKMHQARVAHAPSVTLWGTGTPLREFLHTDDLARALIYLLEHYEGEDAVNVGSGEEVTIRTLAGLIKDAVGYTGDIVFDSSKPDGTPRKFLDSARIRALGWAPSIKLAQGLAETYDWFCERARPSLSA